MGINISHNLNSANSYQSTLAKIGNSISEAIAKVAQIALSIIYFPTRYFGSKTWHAAVVDGKITILKNPGYHTTLEAISRDKLCSSVPYAAACVSAHCKKNSWIEPFGLSQVSPRDLNIDRTHLPDSLIEKEDCFFDTDIGLKVDIMKNNTTGEVIVVYGAFSSSNSELSTWIDKKGMLAAQGSAVGSTLLGLSSELFDKALLLQKEITKALPDTKITLAGHSLGGALAQYVGLHTATQAICFNSFPLGAGLQQDIGREKLFNADRYVTHISCQTDWASDNQFGAAIIDTVCCSIGITTPGNFGRRLAIPSAYTGTHDTHDYIFGSIMKHLGYNTRTTSQELSPDDRALAMRSFF